MKTAHVVLHLKVSNLQVRIWCRGKWWWYGTINGQKTTNPFQDQENQWKGM
jgi:hypothetical protein